MTDIPNPLGEGCALVLIDLQGGIVTRETAPYPASQVVTTAARLSDAFRAAGRPVVLVTVGWAPDMADAPLQPYAAAIPAPADMDAFTAIDPAIGPIPGDILIRKRSWGAFYGTDLDLQLRRRGIHTIVLAGIATNMGVESTARAAWEHGYSIIFVEDATTSFGDAMHRFSFDTIFPKLGLVADAAAVLEAHR